MREPAREVLAFPLSRGFRPVGGVAALVLLSVLVVPALVLGGYALRVARAVADGAEELPPLEDPVALGVDGARLLAVHAPVLVVAAALVVVGGPAWVVVPLLAVLAYGLGTITVGFVRSDDAGETYRSVAPLARSGRYARGFLAVAVLVLASAVVLVVGTLLVTAVLATVLLGTHYLVAGLWPDRTLELVVVAAVLAVPAALVWLAYVSLASSAAWGTIVDRAEA